MSDQTPRPWLESGAPTGVAKLLESARDDGPSAAALGKLGAKLAAAGLFGPGGPTGGGGGGGGGHGPLHPGPASHAAQLAKPVALGAKAILFGTVGVAAVGGAAFQAGRVVERRAQEHATVAAVVPPPAPVALPPAPVALPPPPEPPREPAPEVDEPAVAPPPVAKPAPRPHPPPVAETVNPDQEAELLTAALAASKRASWQQALAAAEKHSRLFPHGALAQEREMIAIEALLNLSRRSEAEARATRFRTQWPTSTHLVRLNTLLHSP